MLAYPFYLLNRSPGKTGSHFDPSCDLFVPAERTMVLTSNACLLAMAGVLAACTYALGPLAMFNLYFMPYWVGVVWLDAVTYLHHHGQDDEHADMPWYVICIPPRCTPQSRHCCRVPGLSRLPVWSQVPRRGVVISARRPDGA